VYLYKFCVTFAKNIRYNMRYSLATCVHIHVYFDIMLYIYTF